MPFYPPLAPVDVAYLFEKLCLQDDVVQGKLIGSNARFFDEDTVESVYRSTPAQPNFGVYQTRRGIFVLCGGLTNMDQGIWVHYAWSQEVTMDRETYGYNPLCYQWARNIYTLGIGKLPHNLDVFLVGHSGGCPTMEALAGIIRQQGKQKLHSIITAGGPRAMYAPHMDGIPLLDRFRFVIPGDPVTYLPPHHDESPASWIAEHAVRGLANALSVAGYPGVPNVGNSPMCWDRIVHTPGALNVYPDGSSTNNPDPFVPAAAVTEIVDWLALSGDWRHAKVHYNARINAWADRWIRNTGGGSAIFDEVHQGGGDWEVAAAVPSPFPEAPEPPIVWGPDLVVALRIRETETMGLTTEPTVTSKPGPAGGRQYSVYLAGKEVATYDARGRANTMARFLKKWLARLPSASKVDRDGLMMGVSSYLELASRGSGVTRQAVTVG